jgi:hypothetical protein
MEPPVRTDSESLRDEKVKVLKAIEPLDTNQVVLGQFRGYRKESGVSPNSKVRRLPLCVSKSIPGVGREFLLHSRWEKLACNLHRDLYPTPEAAFAISVCRPDAEPHTFKD